MEKRLTTKISTPEIIPQATFVLLVKKPIDQSSPLVEVAKIDL